MGRKMFVVGLILILSLLLAGCGQVVEEMPPPEVQPSTDIVTPTSMPTPTLQPVFPAGSQTEIEVPEGIQTACSPAFIKIGSVGRGDTIDTWTVPGVLNIFGVEIPYNEGEQLCIVVYNGFDKPVDFVASYSEKLEPSYCESAGDGILYSATPSNFSQYVALPNEPITIYPKHACKIPYSFVIPGDALYPEYWEFGVRMDYISGVDVRTGYNIRVLVAMVD